MFALWNEIWVNLLFKLHTEMFKETPTSLQGIVNILTLD